MIPHNTFFVIVEVTEINIANMVITVPQKNVYEPSDEFIKHTTTIYVSKVHQVYMTQI